MREEIEEAIERLLLHKEYTQLDGGTTCIVNKADIETVLNYIKDSTPNSVIREKIEELENSQKRVKNNNLIYSREDVFRFQIYVLEEILKEGEK